MHRFLVPYSRPETSDHTRSSADFITTTSGSRFSVQTTGDSPRYLIRDRDGIYGTLVTRRLRAMGIRDKPTAPASPWQNSFAERLIGSIRREFVDHLVVLGEAHYAESCAAMLTTTTKSERTGLWLKMHLSPDPFSGPEPLGHMQSLVGFITIMCGSRFSVQTGTAPSICADLICDRDTGQSARKKKGPARTGPSCLLVLDARCQDYIGCLLS